MNNKILIIDDDRELLEELKELLIMGGYEVMVLSDSEKALEWVAKHKPKIVLLDLKMFPKSGFQIADDLRYCEDRKEITVIAMSGHFTQKDHLFLMKQCGVEAFLTKPFKPLNLISQIELVSPKNDETGFWNAFGNLN